MAITQFLMMNHVNGRDHQRATSPRYDPVHAASSETSTQNSSLPSHVPGEQPRPASSRPGHLESSSEQGHHGALPSLHSSLGSLPQGAAGESPWNQWERVLQPNPLLQSASQTTPMRFRGELGDAGQYWAPQVADTAATESPGAATVNHSPMGWRSPGAAYYNPESNLPPIVVGAFVPLRAANSHPSPPSFFPNPLRSSQTPGPHSLAQATCKSPAAGRQTSIGDSS